MDDLIKKFGKGVLITGDKLKDVTNPIVHVSPKLDIVLGGGIPGGSVVTLAGMPKSGKTLSALHIAGNAQKCGRPIYYLNVEGRIKPRDIDGIKCLDKSKLNIVRSYRDEGGTSHILTAEEFLAAAEHIIHTVPSAVVIIDSISQLVTSGELSKDIGEQSRAPGAMLLAQFTRKLSNVIPVNDIILIGILHFIANTSGYGKSQVASGGNKIKYACDIGLECKGFTYLRDGGKEDNTSKPYGQEVTWVTTSTAFAPPGQTTTSTIKYGVGIDELTELVQVAQELGFISKSGSWYKMTYMQEVIGTDYDEKKYNVQGERNLVLRLENNEGERLALEKALQAMITV